MEAGRVDPSAASDYHERLAAAPHRVLIEFAIAALRSNQDVLLHKVERSQVVREQLAVNRDAIVQLQEALSRV